MNAPKIKRNARQQMDGLHLLGQLEDRSAAAVFLDPEYRGVLDMLAYGNEGEGRQSARAALPQMSSAQIAKFVEESQRVLQSSGHLFLWIDKFALVSGSWQHWMPEITPMREVDLITWDKETMGNGKRTRYSSEFLLVIQKGPRRAEGVWKDHSLRDVVRVKPVRTNHPHAKPTALLQRLIECVTEPGDLVVDPCAGGYGVLDACRASARQFVGCDLL